MVCYKARQLSSSQSLLDRSQIHMEGTSIKIMMMIVKENMMHAGGHNKTIIAILCTQETIDDNGHLWLPCPWRRLSHQLFLVSPASGLVSSSSSSSSSSSLTSSPSSSSSSLTLSSSSTQPTYSKLVKDQALIYTLNLTFYQVLSLKLFCLFLSFFVSAWYSLVDESTRE